MINNFKRDWPELSVTVLCDTDFLVALYIAEDLNHAKANEILNKYNSFIVTNITFYEVLTVLSRKLEQLIAIKILNQIQKDFSNILIFDQGWELEVYKIYTSFEKKNISFFDCACLFLATENNFKIASFDKFYPSDLLA